MRAVNGLLAAHRPFAHRQLRLVLAVIDCPIARSKGCGLRQFGRKANDGYAQDEIASLIAFAADRAHVFLPRAAERPYLAARQPSCEWDQETTATRDVSRS